MGCVYLCSWMEKCIDETLVPTTELEESLRNGVCFAKLGHFMSPERVPLKKIYDKDESRHRVCARKLGFFFIKFFNNVSLEPLPNLWLFC